MLNSVMQRPTKKTNASIRVLPEGVSMSTLTNQDTRERFEARSRLGKPQRTLSLLDKLNRAD